MSADRIPGYCTLQEAAAIIGVSHAQVSRYVSAGLLAAVNLGNQYLVKLSDAKAFRRPPRGNPNFLRGAIANR